MKKKILACVMGVLLVFSACMFTACGSSFDGKYEEVTSEQVQTYAKSVTNDEMDKNSKGVKLVYNLKITNGEQEETHSVSITSTISDGELQGSIEAYAKKGNNSEEIKLYAKDNYVYNNYKKIRDGEEVTTSKKKVPSLINFDAVVDIADSVVSMTPVVDLSLLEIINNYQDELGIKFYMDTTSKDVTKVKISVDGEYGKGDYYFLFNAKKEVVGVKMEITQKEGTSTATLSYSVEYYTGKVKFPRDLDSYQTSL